MHTVSGKYVVNYITFIAVNSAAVTGGEFHG